MNGEASSGADAMLEVRLVGIPTDIQAASQQHVDELLREFMLIAGADPEEQASVPRKLLDLVDRLSGQYAATADPAQRLITEARAAGRETVDVVYQVPAGAVEAAVELGEQLDEADVFCARGDMLTLETPAPLVAFRRWYLGEFVRQAEGRPPLPWSEYPHPVDGSDS